MGAPLGRADGVDEGAVVEAAVGGGGETDLPAVVQYRVDFGSFALGEVEVAVVFEVVDRDFLVVELHFDLLGGTACDVLHAFVEERYGVGIQDFHVEALQVGLEAYFGLVLWLLALLDDWV